MTKFLGKTLFKLEQFRMGILPKPRYRIHLLPDDPMGHMLCFPVKDGKDYAEEVYLYDRSQYGERWLSELDFIEDEDL